MKKAIDEHATYNTAELDKICPVKKGAATRRRFGEQAAVDMYTMGTSFVRKVRDVRQMTGANWRGGGRHGGIQSSGKRA